MVKSRVFDFYGTCVSYRAEGVVLDFRVLPRKKEVRLRDKYSAPSMSCKEFHRELNRAICAIKGYYNF